MQVVYRLDTTPGDARQVAEHARSLMPPTSKRREREPDAYAIAAAGLAWQMVDVIIDGEPTGMTVRDAELQDALSTPFGGEQWRPALAVGLLYGRPGDLLQAARDLGDAEVDRREEVDQQPDPTEQPSDGLPATPT